MIGFLGSETDLLPALGADYTSCGIWPRYTASLYRGWFAVRDCMPSVPVLIARTNAPPACGLRRMPTRLPPSWRVPTVKRHGKVTPSEGGQAAKNDPFLRNGFTMAFMLNGGPVWDACCGNNWKDPSRAFCRRKGDQGDLPGPWDIAADGTQGDPVGTDVF